MNLTIEVAIYLLAMSLCLWYTCPWRRGSPLYTTTSATPPPRVTFDLGGLFRNHDVATAVWPNGEERTYRTTHGIFFFDDQGNEVTGRLNDILRREHRSAVAMSKFESDKPAESTK